jgi:hypothetical protein
MKKVGTIDAVRESSRRAGWFSGHLIKQAEGAHRPLK